MFELGPFLSVPREEEGKRSIQDRLKDSSEFTLPLSQEALSRQASRCMNCGIPFCHGAGCPVANRIPEFNALVRRGQWREACDNLHTTNNFPEITGRVCPAPCEASCTLNINDDPVLIRHIELQIAERGFSEGWIRPRPPATSTGKRVAIVGSGPAGLAAAQQLARAGHEAVVFERNERPGGLLRYGIPDFKLDKAVIDRRLDQLRAEGVQFQSGVSVGEDISPRYLRKMFDATLLAIGAEKPRDLLVSGRGHDNVFFAMEYLGQQNRLIAGEIEAAEELIDATGKVVVVVGGGDTGSDCVGTAIRQGAREVHQFEILPEPPAGRNPKTPWPQWPNILRTTSSHEEGCQRRWSVLVQQLSGSRAGVQVSQLHGCDVEWVQTARGMKMIEKPDTDFVMDVDLVLIAMGFAHVAHLGLVDALDLALDDRNNIRVEANHMTSVRGVFAAGDSTRGASLVVRAIEAGRQAAGGIDGWLRGSS